jgi:hypothetical protein
MNTHADKTQENKSQSVAANSSQMQGGGESTFQFVDNRPEAVAQRKLQEMANNSPQVSQLMAFQDMANNSPQAKQAAQLQAMADNNSILTQNQPVVQCVVDPTQLKGRSKMLYDRLPIMLMESNYPDEWKSFLQQAENVDELTERVNTFLDQKDQEKRAEEDARKAKSAEKHRLDIEKAQAEAAEKRRVEDERIAAEEAAKAAADAAAAAVAAAAAEEQERLKNLFEAGKHKILSLKDIEGYINLGYIVNHGIEFKDTDKNQYGEKIDNLGIYININPGGGAAMTTHFHVHDGTNYGGPWDAHFKIGQAANANQGGYVSKEEALQLYGLIEYNP